MIPDWLWIVAAIVGVLAAGMLRERWRLRGMEDFARQHGFVLHSPFTPGERPPLAALAERLEGRPPTRWGAGITGVVDGIEIAIAEHETPARGADATGSPHTIGIWRVMAAWPLRSAGVSADPGDPWPHGGQLVCDGEWAAWRLRGNLTQANVETLLAHLPAARRRFE
ncbi:MAG: hypothetical protein HUU23_01335 [Caldilineales bacterium]|nr:hypothetical protein [Caldilineales bacterium]